MHLKQDLMVQFPFLKMSINLNFSLHVKRVIEVVNEDNTKDIVSDISV